ncbi:hypothetical protein RHBI111906_10675 [Rhodothermus bifroesti]|nr:hypothetical protein HRbin18_01127 [bacterium HR18]
MMLGFILEMLCLASPKVKHEGLVLIAFVP